MTCSFLVRKPLALTLLLALLASLAVAGPDDGKKKKKKKKSRETAAATEAGTGTEASKPEAGASGGPPAAFVEARRHLLAYETDAARKTLEDTATDDDAWLATARCWLLDQEGSYEAAAAQCRRAAEIDPSNAAPVLQLGESLAYSQQESAAQDAYARAEARAREQLAARPDDPEALYYLGVAEQRRRRFDQSAATLEKARKLRPDDPLVLFQLGVTHFYQQRWQEAYDTLSAALDRNSGIALAYYYRGLAAGKIDRKDVLYNDLDRFVRMAPDAPEAANARQILSSFGG